MITFVNKYRLAAVFLLLVYTSLFSQNSPGEQYDLALKLYGNKEYYNCITELKRFLYFDKSGDFNYRANHIIGQCYKSGALLDDAIKYFMVSSKFAGNNEDLYNSKIEIVRCNILRRTTSNALQILAEIGKDERFVSKRQEINYWKGWAYIFSDEWEKASEFFSQIDPTHPLAVITKETADKKYSMSFAKVISYILPGSGQIYTGHIFPGLLSLGWNGTLAYFSIRSFYEERIFDGFITTGLFSRFHRGNMQNTEEFVKQENIKIVNETMNYLQYEYKGLKP